MTKDKSSSALSSLSSSSCCYYNSNIIGEIIPGLWIGGLNSINEIVKIQKHYPHHHYDYPTKNNNNYDNCYQWTIISIINSDSLINYVKHCIDELSNVSINNVDKRQKDQKRDDNNQKISVLVINHFVWKLKDTSKSNFLSKRLKEILHIIDMSIDIRNNKVCLVHCVKGISRSVSVCVAWLLSSSSSSSSSYSSGTKDDEDDEENNKIEGIEQQQKQAIAPCYHNHHYGVIKTIEESLKVIRKVRSNAMPNIGFLASLRAIEQCHGNIDDAMNRMEMRRMEHLK